MRTFSANSRFLRIPALLLTVLMLASCASPDREGRPLRSRSDYDYVMPPELRIRPTPTAIPTPTPLPGASSVSNVVEPEEEMEEESGERRSWFGRLFSRGDRDEGETGEDASREMAATPDAVAGEGGGDAPADSGQQVDNHYHLKAGDAVYITLTGPGGLNEQIETVIDEQGNVKLRFIGAVSAKGRTTTELEGEIEAEYTERQKIYKEVVARVVVPNTFYFIGGEVRQPGRYPIVGRVTLSQAIVAAGNFTEWAKPERIILVRGDERIELNFREIRENPRRDVELLPGDVVRVSRSII